MLELLSSSSGQGLVYLVPVSATSWTMTAMTALHGLAVLVQHSLFFLELG